MVSWLDFGGGGRSRRPHGEVRGDRRLMPADARSGPATVGGAYMPPPTVTPPMSGLRASPGSEFGPGGGIRSTGLDPQDDGFLRSTIAAELAAATTRRPGAPREEDRERLPAGALALPLSPAEGLDLSVLPPSGPMVLGPEDPFVRSPEGTLSSMARAAVGPSALPLQGLTATSARLPTAPEASGLPGAMGFGSGVAPSAARLLTPRAFPRGGGGGGGGSTIDVRIRVAAEAKRKLDIATAELLKAVAVAKAVSDTPGRKPEMSKEPDAKVLEAANRRASAQRAYDEATKSLPKGTDDKVKKDIAARIQKEVRRLTRDLAREAHLTEMAESRAARRFSRRLEREYSLSQGQDFVSRVFSALERLSLQEAARRGVDMAQGMLATLAQSRIDRTHYQHRPYRPTSALERDVDRERNRQGVIDAEADVGQADAAVDQARSNLAGLKKDISQTLSDPSYPAAMRIKIAKALGENTEDLKRELEEAKEKAKEARRALAEARAGHAGRVRAVRRAERAVKDARKDVKRAAKWAETAGKLYGPEAREKAQKALEAAKKQAADAAADLAKKQKALVDGTKAPTGSPASADPAATGKPGEEPQATGPEGPKDKGTTAPPDTGGKPAAPAKPEGPDEYLSEGEAFSCAAYAVGSLQCGVPPCNKCDEGYECVPGSCTHVPVAQKGKADVGAGAASALMDAGRPYNPSLEYAAAMPPQTEAGIGTREAKAPRPKPEHWSAKVPPGHPRVKAPPSAAGSELRAAPEAAVSYEASPFGAIPFMESPNISAAFWSVISNVVPLFAQDAVAVAPGGPPGGGPPPMGPGGGAAARTTLSPADSAQGAGAVQAKPYIKELVRLHAEIQRKTEQVERAEKALFFLEWEGDFRQKGTRKALLGLREERDALQAEVRRIEEQHGVAFPSTSATDRLIDQALLFVSVASLPGEAVGRVFTAVEGLVVGDIEGLLAFVVWAGEKLGFDVEPGLASAILEQANGTLHWAASQSGLLESSDTRAEGLQKIVGGILKAASILFGQPIGEDQHSWEALADAFLLSEDPLEIKPGMSESEKNRLRWLQFARLLAYLLMALLAKWAKDRGQCPCPPEGKGPPPGETPAGETKAPKTPEGTAETGGKAEVAPEGSRAANPPTGRGSASAAIEKAKAAGPDQASRAKAWEETAAEYERAGLWERGSAADAGTLGEKVYLGGRADQVVVIGKDGSMWRSVPGSNWESLYSTRVVEGRIVYEVNYANFVKQ